MANDAIWTYASQVTLESTGATCATNAFVAADDASLTSGNHNDYPYADFVLKTVGHAAAVGSNGVVNLYRQDLDIDGTFDAAAPSASNPVIYVGNFRIPDSQASNVTNYYALTDVPLSKACAFFIENKASQSQNVGWTLKATPKTLTPST